MIKSFLAYELAVELHRKVEVITKQAGLKHSMKDQLERAAQSVALNLAEGSGKPTKADKIRFYAIAFGSVREVQAVFDLIQIEDPAIIDLVDHLAACVYRLTYGR